MADGLGFFCEAISEASEAVVEVEPFARVGGVRVAVGRAARAGARFAPLAVRNCQLLLADQADAVPLRGLEVAGGPVEEHLELDAVAVRAAVGERSADASVHELALVHDLIGPTRP